MAHEVGIWKNIVWYSFNARSDGTWKCKKTFDCSSNDSILKQWWKPFLKPFRMLKVNVLGNLGKDYDLSKFDNKDGEITIVTYEGFNNIGFQKILPKIWLQNFPTFLKTN